MPFFGVPGGFLDAAGKFGKLVGKGALSVGKSLGEELISAAKPVVMEEVAGLKSAAKDYLQGEARAAMGFAGRGLSHVREQARGFITGTNAESRVGVNDITAYGDKARDRMGETLINAKRGIQGLAGRLLNAGSDTLERAARRVDGMGNTTMAANTKSLNAPLPNDVAARQNQSIMRNYDVNAANNAQNAAMYGLRNKHHNDGRKVHRAGKYKYRL